MSQTLTVSTHFIASAPRAARPRAARAAIDWSLVAERAATLRDAAGDAMLIGLAVLPALAGGAMLLTAFGFKIV